MHTLCDRAVHDADVLRVGRTHLQGTSPVTFGWHFAQYAARLADRFMRCDDAYANLRGKVRGIVGTGASIEQVVGVGGALGFERDVLAQLGLLPHRGSSQIVPRENLADAAHAIATLGMVLGDFANDIRLLYATGIAEVTTSTDAALLGLSSADATKNNPVNYENVIGKATMLKHLMGIVYELIPSDLERDLTNSVMGRYEPQGMMVMVHEMHARMGERCLPGLTIVRDNAEANLQRVRDNPGEAMTAILRGVEGWRSSTYGPGHDFVNKVAIQAQKDGSRLLDVAMTDPDFAHAYHSQMTETQRAILGGQLELYVGAVPDIIASNVSYARDLAARSFVPAVSVK
ncbi:hypothetical protein COY28_00700 [Candidatus Woesearchaeota archaeon CG_4_10_14_0_2_um_filter_57_5]|nr:MAG: hypothetical protein COY28_00700 [Candidatus Woesearchaeota archaeon CG_4_10_14_0_2_um_filter_57_5]